MRARPPYTRGHGPAPRRARPDRAPARRSRGATSARHHELIGEARARRVPTSSSSRSWASPATCSRTSTPRSRCAATTRASSSSPGRRDGIARRRLVRRGIGRPPALHRRGAARGRRASAMSIARSSCPPTGSSTSAASSRPARTLRAHRQPPRACGWASASARTSGTSPRPQLLALDGAQVLINVSSSPGRDVAAVNEDGLGTADLVADAQPDVRPADHELRRLRQPRRRGRVDHLLGRLARSWAHRARACSRRPTHDEGLFVGDIDPAELRRERIATPLLRDERPEVVLRQLDRIVREPSRRAASRTEAVT